jgi:hypothetical protein
MPTINEVWEQAQQINANLVIVHNDLTALTNQTNLRLTALSNRVEETNDWLEEMRQLLNGGFASVSSGFTGIHARQDITNASLLHQIEQIKTVLCVLEHISQNTCQLLNHAAKQTGLQEQMAADLGAQRYMFAAAHPDAALALQRETELRRKVEECCPLEQVKDPCHYEECKRPAEIREPRPPAFTDFVPQPSRVQRRRGQP